MEQIEASIDRYLSALDVTDRQEGEVAQAKAVQLKDKIAALKQRMEQLKQMEVAVNAAPDRQISLTDPDARSAVAVAMRMIDARRARAARSAAPQTFIYA